MADSSTSIFVFGASGDLALNKTFPSLYELYLAALLPPSTTIVGYARSALTDAQARERWGTNLKAGTPETRAAFLALCSYRHGPYDSAEAFGKVGAPAAGRARSAPPRPPSLTLSPPPPSPPLAPVARPPHPAR